MNKDKVPNIIVGVLLVCLVALLIFTGISCF